ncbi:MAG: hypothetical protein C4B59_05060 [Candidatus Methanogaster sp.]|uniref:Uncharacterized protein n=1 Tax=Candidatus Methanogaster sp. TaxID=3386292 RepID=A0AC61L4I5_9EURY|nr:MAG: hypothetical protein C4B59_05060 [ANME-2 cluster archaeon]
MLIVEVLVASTAPVVVKFLFDQVKNYRRRGKKTKEMEKFKNTLEPFKERLEVNETELMKIKENAEKLSEILTENGFEITDEMYQKWTLNFLDEKLSGIKQDKPTFKIELWTTKSAEGIEGVRDIKILPRKYRIGDRIVVYFKPDRDCYLTLFNIGTSGKLTILFPNYLFQNNFTKADRIHAIPGDEYPFEYELSGPSGVEKIKAIATTSELNLLDFEFSREEFFHSVESGVAARDISIVAKRMEEVSVDSWAEVMCEFEVE